MPTSSTYRNMLFGILALQLDFIDRDQLVSGMDVWVLQKSKQLADILCEQGALQQESRDLLSALVEKHLEKHDNDPAKSLGAVSSIGSARKDLEEIADADVQQSLAIVSRDRREGDPNATMTYSVGDLTSRGQRFRILRPHAKGGIGQVSVALDEELHREVALKEIQDQFADDPERRRRFVREAEITGALEHPGIIPIYGLGSYADGRPFYAMRFVRGDSLQNAIEQFHRAEGPFRDPSERSLERRQLLGRFVDVCCAIEYAHTRRILHRDLKPGNIMIGKHGETLVVDWGLAKVVDQPERPCEPHESRVSPYSGSDPASTRIGTIVGTPAYMSPEQATGTIDELGPASDVYSLGATLYSLIAGQSPFTDSDLGIVLQKVQKGEFPRPSDVKSLVPPSLQAICLKAMSLKAEDRYRSPRHLAEDIEHWLADEPVSVYREPASVRVLRWARRHRNWFWSGAASATAGLVLAGILITATPESEDLRLARVGIVGLFSIAIIGGFILIGVPYAFGLVGRAVWSYFRWKRTPLGQSGGSEAVISELERTCEQITHTMGQIEDEVSKRLRGNEPRRRGIYTIIFVVVLFCSAVATTISIILYCFGGERFVHSAPIAFLLSLAGLVFAAVVRAIGRNRQ